MPDDSESKRSDHFEEVDVAEVCGLSFQERVDVEVRVIYQDLIDEFMDRLREEFNDYLRNYRDYVINNFEQQDRSNITRQSHGVVRGDELDAIDEMGSQSEIMEQEFENRARQIFEELFDEYQATSRVSKSEAD